MITDYTNIKPAAILVTGGFDPLHSGHINYLKSAHKLNNNVIVGLNSDEWLARKKGKSFMPYKERESILKELKCVSKVISFNDNDNTANDAIKQCLEDYYVIIFANGGDRHNNNTIEYDLYNNNERVIFKWEVGGSNKQNSSSWILNDYVQGKKVERTWGYYRLLHTDDNFHVKELVIKPRNSLSMQKHKHRSETWNVVKGECYVLLNNERVQLKKEENIFIPVDTWHKGINESDKECHIIEIWRGENKVNGKYYFSEEDIERKKLIM